MRVGGALVAGVFGGDHIVLGLVLGNVELHDFDLGWSGASTGAVLVLGEFLLLFGELEEALELAEGKRTFGELALALGLDIFIEVGVGRNVLGGLVLGEAILILE